MTKHNDKYWRIDPNTRKRINFLKKLPKNGIVAEIGVWRGKNALNILNNCEPSQLYLIDTWITRTKPGDEKVRTKEEWQEILNKVYELFNDHDHVKIIRQESLEASKSFDDEFFDWIYIDAGHSYSSCYLDLMAWFPKIKIGGYICGHDYCENRATVKKSFGVKQAVDRFMLENDAEIEFLSENVRATDYAIKKDK
jgi:predicted O-methyltransferase YrrM